MKRAIQSVICVWGRAPRFIYKGRAYILITQHSGYCENDILLCSESEKWSRCTVSGAVGKKQSASLQTFHVG